MKHTSMCCCEVSVALLNKVFLRKTLTCVAVAAVCCCWLGNSTIFLRNCCHRESSRLSCPGIPIMMHEPVARVLADRAGQLQNLIGVIHFIDRSET